MRRIVASFEHRAGGAGGARRWWERATAALDSTGSRPKPAARAVLANALALVHFPERGDVDDLAVLVEEHGRHEVAELQEAVLGAVDGRDRPLTTRLVRVLAGYAWARPGAPLPADGRTGPAQVAGEAVVRLLMVGDATGERPAITGTGDLLAVFERQGIRVWRALVAATVDDPWTGSAERHLELLDPDAQPFEVASIRAVLDLSRREAEQDERRAVAAHIRSTIDQTGLTQREFAALVGTSPSRLSTYVTGAVTPSAAMLLRINRAARRAQPAVDPQPEQAKQPEEPEPSV